MIAQLLPVTLPDLSRLEESVQAQLRERYAALTAKRGDPRTAASDLATEYGEMGKLLLAAELLDPAEAALLNAQALAADAMTWPYYLGHLYRKKGDIPKATVAFERALRLSPSDVPTMTWLGEAALDQGRPDAAEPLFAKAVSLEPGSAAAHYGLGRAALGRKDYAGAARHLEQALALDGKRVGDPLLAGDGVPRPGRSASGGVASAATRHAADETRPVDEGARRAAQQRADLRKERGRCWQQRRVVWSRRSISGRPSHWPRRAHRRITNWGPRSST